MTVAPEPKLVTQFFWAFVISDRVGQGHGGFEAVLMAKCETLTEVADGVTGHIVFSQSARIDGQSGQFGWMRQDCRQKSGSYTGVMREPAIETDGWCLDDGEEYHARSPDSFWLPDRAMRENLQTGDFAKLIFRISVDDPDKPIAVERMWVLVRERINGGYLGVLDNDPTAIDENDTLWSGIELPFQPHHVINIERGDEQSFRLASSEPKRRWT